MLSCLKYFLIERLLTSKRGRRPSSGTFMLAPRVQANAEDDWYARGCPHKKHKHHLGCPKDPGPGSFRDPSFLLRVGCLFGVFSDSAGANPRCRPDSDAP